MSQKINQFAVFFMVFLVTPVIAEADIIREIVDYQVQGKPFKGYLSYDNAIKGKRPGIIIVHEWWGHNAYTRKRADKLAQAGYTAFALDMYGAGKLAEHPDDAKKFMQAVLGNMPEAEQRFNSAKQLLQKHQTVDSGKIAAIGYCFGGGIVLHMARQGADLDAVVSFHGPLATTTPAQTGKVKAKIMVFNGADDPFITAQQVESIASEMQTAGVDFKMKNYPGAKHSFTNPEADALGKRFDMPLSYDATADQDSWQRMLDFFREAFRK